MCVCGGGGGGGACVVNEKVLKVSPKSLIN